MINRLGILRVTTAQLFHTISQDHALTLHLSKILPKLIRWIRNSVVKVSIKKY
jgi:hypothetical protein